MGAKCCHGQRGSAESVNGSVMTLADLQVQETDLTETTVEEIREASGPSEQNSPSPTSGPSEVTERLGSVTLGSQEETSNTNESPRNPGQDAYKESDILWSTGSYADKIPDGFYSVIPDNRLELCKSIPTLDELRALGDEGHMTDVILINFSKDKMLFRLKQFITALVGERNSNRLTVIKKIAGLVRDIYRRNNLQSPKKDIQPFGRHDFPLLGKIKHGSCRARALLFKVLADTVGHESKIVVGFPSDQRSSANSHMSVVVVHNNVEMLVDLVRSPGQLVPLSDKAIYMAHNSAAGNDSCNSPLVPNSSMYRIDHESSEKDGSLQGHRKLERSSPLAVLQSGLSSSRSEPNIATGFWQHSQGNVIMEQLTASSSYKLDGPGKMKTKRIRRSHSATPVISDDVIRAVRARKESLKQSRFSKERGGDGSSPHSPIDRTRSPVLQKNVSGFHLDSHGQVSGGRSALDLQKAVSLPSSPQNNGNQISETSEPSHRTMNDIWIEVTESSMFQNKPLLPYEEWNIDFSELTVGPPVGIGFFGIVHRGIWNETDVAIKKFLEKDLTAEEMEDFCNEISILSRLRHPNVILFLGACTKPPHLSLVTEFMESGSLSFVLHSTNQKEKLSCWRRKLKMMRGICRGLMYLHRMGIVHCDLKSANCLLTNHWTVKICDFGLSRMKKGTTMKDTISAGSPEWMAPELLRKEAFSEKCDIFSFGVVMWELCTLSKPWEGVPKERVIYTVAAEGARLEIPEGPVGKLIADCWLEPEQRPSCGEILSRLKLLERSLG